MDSDDYEMEDFFILVDNLLAQTLKPASRAFTKLFTTLNLLSTILWTYSKENNNLLPAITGTSFILLRTWAWILKGNMTAKAAVIKQYNKLLQSHCQILEQYFDKTLPAAVTDSGLYVEQGGMFENIGFPLRVMDYISQLIFYYQLVQAGVPTGIKPSERQLEGIYSSQLKTLFTIIKNNEGSRRPLLDRHSAPILLVSLFVLNSKYHTHRDLALLNTYLVGVLEGIEMVSFMRHRLPEFNDNIDALVETAASGKKAFEYQDKSSMLILIITELMAVLNKPDSYNALRQEYNGTVNLQTSYPNWNRDPLQTEISYFQGNIHDDMISESSVTLPENMEDFIKQIQAKPKGEIPFITDTMGFSFLRTLSVHFYHNDIFPHQWRIFFKLD
ncbi:hypothetical protein QFZ48_004084 [Chitinophaga sp. W2I13]|uniref:hypothetical protein n=1 Tax=Chitinophaga sp. W2I13 TaxID=3373923 RepID=UPI003D1D3DFD